MFFLKAKFRKTCQTCFKRFKAADTIVPLAGSFYHETCLLCAECHRPAKHQIISKDQVTLVCDYDFEKNEHESDCLRELSLCHGCLKDITTQPQMRIDHMTFPTQCWHQSCFNIHKVWGTSASTFLNGNYAHLRRPSGQMGILEWQEHVDRVWDSCRDLDTFLGDHRASAKGFLDAGFIKEGTMIAQRMLKMLMFLLKIVEEFEQQFPISKAYTNLIPSKQIITRFQTKLNGIIADVNCKSTRIIRTFDITQTGVLLEMTRDAAKLMIQICAGCFLIDDLSLNEIMGEHIANIRAECRQFPASPWKLSEEKPQLSSKQLSSNSIVPTGMISLSTTPLEDRETTAVEIVPFAAEPPALALASPMSHTKEVQTPEKKENRQKKKREGKVLDEQGLLESIENWTEETEMSEGDEKVMEKLMKMLDIPASAVKIQRKEKRQEDKLSFKNLALPEIAFDCGILVPEI